MTLSHMSFPLIKEHIKNPDWRYRDAAVMAFGCILQGPEPNQLKPLVTLSAVSVGVGSGIVYRLTFCLKICL